VIPAVLTLRNFLCYRENCPPLDFTGIRVACLTGENGNGKSALLDAMTWALWGEARARTDDELIHLGRTEMEVEFEFLSDDQRYRVIRKRRKGTQRSAGATALEFHLLSPAGWKPLTANHVRETEARIRDVLKLDYETFVNSAFLMQGKADAFTVKSPGERKRILGEILGLAQYDRLEQQARYERAFRDEQARAAQQELVSLSEALVQEPALLEERRGLQDSLAEIEEQVAVAGSALEHLRQEQRLIELQRQQAEAAEKRRLEAAAEVARAACAIEEHQRDVLHHDAVICDAPEIEAGFQRLDQALETERGLSERFRRHAEISRRHAACQAAIDQSRLRLVADEEAAALALERVRVAAQEAGAGEADRAALRARSAALDLQQEGVDKLRADEQQLREEAGALRSQNLALRAQMDTIKQKQTDLSSATVCPLCKTELGAAGQAHIIQSYELEGRSLAAQFREHRASIDEHEQRAGSLQAELQAQELQLRTGRAALSRDEAAFDSVARRVAEAAEQLPQQAQTLESLRRRLSKGDYAAEQRQQLCSLDDELASVGYDPAEHDCLRIEVERLRPFDERHRALTVARAQLQTASAALEQSRRLLADWQHRLAESTEECAGMQGLLSDQRERLTELGAAEARLYTLQADQRRHQQALGAVAQKLDDCARQRRQQAAKQAALTTALDERHIYDELAGAFSRRGIQGLIIDHVIPEITEEANRLLARMTNNRLRVAMDTQRQTQKGGVAETLDIRIADELGTRNYELFSGGEAFRINLALRIALSKLLARRAGAALPTLVIDEGFGSQDSAALERLIEAINVIQDDFQCLLIVTHLAELKDQFPIRINVSKSADGALAEISA
jgi:DNA repair protein SbcC/Rad50